MGGGGMSTVSAATPACTLCGAPGSRVFLEARDHVHVKLGRPYAFAACVRCGVHFLVGDGNPEDVYTAEKASTVVVAGERRYVHWDDAVVRALVARGVRGRVLDFGSGLGHWLAAARAAGLEAEGLDVSPSLAEEARARSGCPVFVGPLEAAPFSERSFAAINVHFALEYVPDPIATVRRFGALLAPGGLVRIFGYATDSLAARLKGPRWWNYTPTRRFLFGDRTVATLAREAGLELVEVLHGGEQPLARYLEEHPAPSLTANAKDALRFTLERVRVGGVSFGSARAWYLRRA
jgi:SAM-dependent methyltransferase